MIKTLKINAFLFILAVSAAACVDSAPTPPSSTTPQPPPRSDRDTPFIAKLEALNAKDPDSDARAAIDSGKKYFLCNVGRSHTIPGLTPETYALARENCPTECLDGVTDAIYGRNHAKYLSAAIAYSATWNQVMIKTCQ